MTAHRGRARAVSGGMPGATALLLCLSFGGWAGAAEPQEAQPAAPLWGGGVQEDRQKPVAAASAPAASPSAPAPAGETKGTGSETGDGSGQKDSGASTQVALLTMSFGFGTLAMGGLIHAASANNAAAYHTFVDDGHTGAERQEEAATLGFITVGLYTAAAILLGTSCYCLLSGDDLGAMEDSEQAPAPEQPLTLAAAP